MSYSNHTNVANDFFLKKKKEKEKRNSLYIYGLKMKKRKIRISSEYVFRQLCGFDLVSTRFFSVATRANSSESILKLGQVFSHSTNTYCTIT